MRPACPVLSLALSALFVSPAAAQNIVPPPGAQPTASGEKKKLLDMLRYDARTQGPLLLVVPIGMQREYQENDAAAAQERFAGKTLAQFGDQIGRRVLRDGNLTALIPRMMNVIVSDPPEADPTAGMRAEERLEILLALLTPAQWRLVGSDTGIGAGDLTEEQQPVFAGLFPADGLTVETMEQHSVSNEPWRTFWAGTGERTTVPVRGVRLRIWRQLLLRFVNANSGSAGGYYTKPGKDEDRYRFQTPDGKVRSVAVTNSSRLAGDIVDSDGNDNTRTAFGQTVVRVETNRAKPGDLALDAPGLGTGIRLDGSQQTVGELLALCAKETRLTLVADKRLAAMPLAWRVAPGGQTASVAGVLKLLCRSLTGTFRRLAPEGSTQPIYLLTDDREGYGTRLARLARWAKSGEEARRNLLRKAASSAAKNDPLSHTRFAPDDPLALPAPFKESLDAHYRTTNTEGVPTKTSDLPPALRAAAEEELGRITEHNPSIIRDRVNVGTVLTCDYVLPDGRAFETRFGENFSTDYLRTVAKVKPAVTAAAAAAPPPRPVAPTIPATAPRRICVLPLPEDADAAETLIRLAKRKGFDEVLFRVSLYQAETPARLTKAVASGRKLSMRVGASAPWLKRHPKQAVGTEDINLAEETGEQAITREIGAIMEQMQTEAAALGVAASIHDETEHIFGIFRDYLSQWIVPDAEIAREPLAQIFAVPNLATFVLTDNVAPGWDQEVGDSHQGPPGSMLGYTLSTRISCVQSLGFDPADVFDTSLHLPFPQPQSYFGTVNLTRELTGFRLRQNRRELARLLESASGRNVPLYVEENASVFTGGMAGYLRYGTEAKSPPEKIKVYRPLDQYQPAKVAGALTGTARTAARTGFVADFGRGSLKDAEEYLKAFADQ